MTRYEAAASDALADDEAMGLVVAGQAIALCRSGGRFFAVHDQSTQERISGGPSWTYAALQAEIPNPGDYTRPSSAAGAAWPSSQAR
jgi:hypothetical protein